MTPLQGKDEADEQAGPFDKPAILEETRAFDKPAILEETRAFDKPELLEETRAFDKPAADEADPEHPQAPDPDRPPTRGEQLLAVVFGALHVYTWTLSKVFVWFAFLFMLFVASLALLVAIDASPFGPFFLYFVLIALVLHAAVYGLYRALRALGGARRPSTADWPFEAASLLAGGLLIAGFLPRALGGATDAPWFDALLALVGVFFVYNPIRGWYRGE